MQLQCDYGSSGYRAAYRMTTQDFPRVLLYACSVPSSSLYATHLDVKISFNHTHPTRQVRVPMQALATSTQEPLLGICVSPVSGKVDLEQLVDWRIHHASLGFQRVFWYDRNGTQDSLLQRTMRTWNRRLSMKDMWQQAPRLLPFGESVDLYSNGEYADQARSHCICQVSILTDTYMQAAYYTDCLTKARSVSSAGWLAMIDLDEWILPTKLPDSALDPETYGTSSAVASLLNQRGPSSASVCFQRINVRGNSATTGDQHMPRDSILSRMTSQYAPSNGRWGYKCIHRIESIQSAFVHWPDELRKAADGESFKGLSLEERIEWVPALAKDGLTIMHARMSELLATPYTNQFQLGPRHKRWQSGIVQVRTRLLAEL